MSNARSPREVCSITIGINGLMWQAPCFRGSRVSFPRRPLLFGRPQLLAGAGELDRDSLHVGCNPVHRFAHAQVFAQELVPAACKHAVDDLLGVVALGVCVLADECAQLFVRHLEAGLVGDGFERKLTRDRPRRLCVHPFLQLLRGLIRDGEVGLGRDPAALERADEPCQELGGARVDEWAGRLDVRGFDQRVGGGGPELRLDLLLDLLADALLEVAAQLGERVELARGARQLVVERRQHPLLQLVTRHLDLRGRAVDELLLDLLRLARRQPDEARVELLDHLTRADVDHEVALGRAVIADEVDDDGVAFARRAPLGRHELCDGEP